MAKPAVFNPVSATPPPKFRHSFWWYLKWFLIVLQLLVFCAILIALSVGKGIYDELQKVVPDLRLLLAKNRAEPSRIYAADGSMLAEFRNEERVWTPLSNLKIWKSWQGQTVQRPGRLIQATLSIEDSRFYSHPGVDAKRIAGALVANFKAGDIKQGGSTITEQLVDNVYLTLKRDFRTRLNSSLIALQLERKLSKDEILEAYLNEIYYGNRCYGAEAAARVYFGKSAKNLTISEAAMLAGLPQSPTRHDPFKNFENAKKRQRIVLREMLQNKQITYAQFNEARTDKSIESVLKRQREVLRAKRATPPKWKSPYFVSYVEGFLKKNYGYDVREPGLKIYTTLDPKLQNIAESTLKSNVARRGRTLQGALVSIDPWTGHVVAMVGGRDYYNKAMNGEFNRAVQGKRQPGSTMKPYIYAAAMEAGLKPQKIEIDAPFWVCGDGECPPGKRSKRRGGHEIRNYTRSHAGAMTLERALGVSNNVIATKLLLKIGIQNAIQKAHLMGIQSSLVPVPTLALGVSEVSLLEHVSAYGVFATKGLRAEPTPIIRVENYSGDVLLEQPTPVRAARVLSPEAANAMYDMMRYVVTNGTGRSVQIRGVELLGKTGTTSSNKDVWFMGASPQLSTGVWMGYDKPTPLGGNSAGGQWCGPVFREFMRQALPIWKARKPLDKLVEDGRATARQRYLAQQYKQYVRVKICTETGLLATRYCTSTRVEVFSAAGGAPSTYCTLHRPAPQPRRLIEENPGAPSSRNTPENSAAPVESSPDSGAYVDESGQLVNPGDAARREYSRENNLGEDPASQTTPRTRAAQPERNSVPAYEGDGVIPLDENGGGTLVPETGGATNGY